MVPTGIVLKFVLLLTPLEAFAKRNGVAKKPISDLGARSYNLSFTAIRYVYANPEYFGPQTAVELHNPSEYSSRLEILKTLPKDAKTVTYTYERNNRGEYVPSITMRETLCEEFKKDLQRLPMYKCQHYHDAGINECPFKKGIYIASRVGCPPRDLPPVLPGHYWKFNRTWIGDKNVLLFVAVVDLTIERKTLIHIGH